MPRTALALAAAALVTLTACQSHSTDAVCVDRHTGLRVPDSQCDHSTDVVTWLYLSSRSRIPAVGHRYPRTGGSFRQPASGVTVRLAPAKGVAPKKPSGSGGVSANQKGAPVKRVAPKPPAPRRVSVRPRVR